MSDTGYYYCEDCKKKLYHMKEADAHVFMGHNVKVKDTVVVRVEE